MISLQKIQRNTEGKEDDDPIVACAPGPCCGWWSGGLGDCHQQKAGDFVGVVFRGIRSCWFVVSFDIKNRWPGILFFTDLYISFSMEPLEFHTPQRQLQMFSFSLCLLGVRTWCAILRTKDRNDQCTVSTCFPSILWHGCRLKRWYPSYICKQSTVEVSACASFCTPHML